MKKNKIALFLALMLIVSIFSGCRRTSGSGTEIAVEEPRMTLEEAEKEGITIPRDSFIDKNVSVRKKIMFNGFEISVKYAYSRKTTLPYISINEETVFFETSHVYIDDKKKEYEFLDGEERLRIYWDGAAANDEGKEEGYTIELAKETAQKYLEISEQENELENRYIFTNATDNGTGDFITNFEKKASVAGTDKCRILVNKKDVIANIIYFYSDEFKPTKEEIEKAAEITENFKVDDRHEYETGNIIYRILNGKKIITFDISANVISDSGEEANFHWGVYAAYI